MSKATQQPELFPTLPSTSPAPTGAGAALSALEQEAAYVLPILCRYWTQATTRNDWRQLADWLDVLSDNAARYKSPALLDEYHLLLLLATKHRKGGNP